MTTDQPADRPLGTALHRLPSTARLREATTADMTLLGLLVVGGALLMIASRHLSFFYDDWDFVLRRRGGSVGAFLDPHNGHLVLFSIVVYRILFALVGLRHFWPYQLCAVALHLVCVWLLASLTRPRLGPWLGLAPAVLLLFMGAAYEDLLWPFQLAFLGSVAGGLGALLALERCSLRGDLAAALLLTWSLSGSAVGVAFLVAAIVFLLAVRAPRARYVPLLVPIVLYAVWYLGWGASESTSADALLAAPQHVIDAASAAAAGTVGLSPTYGPTLLAIGLLGTAFALARRRSSPPPMLLAAISGAVVFWLLTAVARSDVAAPGASRYLYIGGLFLMLTVASGSAGLSLGRAGTATLVVLLAGAVTSNIGLLRQGEQSFRLTDQTVRATLAAVQVAAPVVAPGFSPDPQGAPQVMAGPYLAAVRSLGSPAIGLDQLQRGPLSLAVAADGALSRAERVGPGTIQHAGRPRPVVVAHTQSVRVTGVHGCDRVRPLGPAADFDLRAAPGTAVVVRPAAGSAVRIYLRRFADQFSEPPAAISAAPAEYAFPTDRAPDISWQMRLVLSSGLTVCASG